jgi:ribonuclease D
LALNHWVGTASAMEDLASVLSRSRSLALDTESDSLHHYFEKVCLVQIANETGESWVVDSLAVRDLSALGPILADPRIPKVLHGADYDVTTLKRDFGFSFAGLFDTMIAARFLGLPEVGLQAVTLAELGIQISKDNQRDDWSRRPLTPKQEAYAAADVQHLASLREKLEAKLLALGREEWVREECDAVAELPPARRGRDPEAFLKIKGIARLSPEGLGALAALHAWRDGLAIEADVPTFKIVSNETLLALATAVPKTPEDLGKIRGISPRLRDRDLLEVVVRASAHEPIVLRRPPRDMPSEKERKRVEALRLWRAEEAKRLGLDVSVVLPQRLIDRLARLNPQSPGDLSAVEGLRRWRIREFGGAFLARLGDAGR